MTLLHTNLGKPYQECIKVAHLVTMQRKSLKRKLDIATEEVASEMKALNNVNQQRVQELLTLINVIQQYQIEVKALL